MNQKAILLSDSESQICNDEVHFINTSKKTLPDTLQTLIDAVGDYIIIYAELKFEDGKRQNHDGIELLKHIRLTPELANINKKPILLLHWMDIEYYIEQDKENIFLFSPSIYRKRLPIDTIKSDKFEQIRDNQLFHEYLFNSEKDEQISAHNFRNKIAIEEFNKQSIQGEIRLLDKPLWFKKLFYRNNDTSQPLKNLKTQLTQELSVLLIDDMANEWKTALAKVLPNANIQICTSKTEALQKINLINDNLKLKREEFNTQVTLLENISDEVDRLKKEESQFTSSLEATEISINSSKKKIADFQKLQEQSAVELKSYIDKFMIGKLAIILASSNTDFDEKIEEINNETRKEAETLRTLITNIVKTKTDLIEENKRLNSFENKKKEYAPKIHTIKSELVDLTAKQKELAPKTSFEKLIQKEFDLVLLDMHLTKESEGKQIERMDGFEILTEMQRYNLKLPTAIFSATTKKQDFLYSKFPSFLYKHEYVKGITRIDHFVELIESMDKNSYIDYLQDILNELSLFPIFLKRIYYEVNSPKYDVAEINYSDRTRINQELNSISKKINTLKSDYSIKTLTDIIHTLSKIQKEYRFKIQNKKRDESLFSTESIKNNQIKNACVELNFRRNRIEHFSESTPKEKAEHSEWEKKLNLREVNKHLKTVYEGLIFDR